MGDKGNFLVGLFAGAAVGAAAAMLLTPKEGRETREIIIDRARDIRDRAEGPISSIRSRIRRNSDDDEDDGNSAD